VLSATAVAYATEQLTDELWDELAPLLEAHWHEIAHYDDIPMRPDKEKYAKIQSGGTLRVYTARTTVPARDRGRLIGYMAVFVNRSLHYADHVFATQDVLFVDPLHRGSRTGVGMIQFAHDELRSEGVTAIYQHTKAKASVNIAPVLTRLLGYELVDQVLACRLDRSE
jgi:GNAT superfamily N-acetyltransferase